MTENTRKSLNKKLCLVLSGGGAKGFAHIGVLKVLQEEGIPVSAISGCSMGALIATLYATGMPISEIEAIANKFTSVREMLKLVDRTPSRRGLIVGKNVRKYLSTYIPPEATFDDCVIPLSMNAVDLYKECEIELREGNLLDCVMASMAIPGFFAPVKMREFKLIDGGALDNLPVKLIPKDPVNFILAIDAHRAKTMESADNQQISFPIPLPEMFHDFFRTASIMTYKLTELNLVNDPPDLLLRPSIPENISIFWGFQKVKEIIASGEQVMRENLPALIAGLED